MSNAFYSDLNEQILSEFLTEEQLDEVMTSVGCLYGVGVGKAIIIALLKMVDLGGSGPSLPSTLQEFRNLALLAYSAEDGVLDGGGAPAIYADRVGEMENLAVPGGGTSATQITALNQPEYLQVSEPSICGPGVDGNDIVVDEILLGSGVFRFDIDCELAGGTQHYIAGNDEASFANGIRIIGARLDFGNIQLTLSRAFTLNTRINIRIERVSNNYVLVYEDAELLHSASFGSTNFRLDNFLGKGNIASATPNFKGKCYSFNLSTGGTDRVQFEASDWDHLGSLTPTGATLGNPVIRQSGNNPTLALHHSAVRSDEHSSMMSTFDAIQTDGRMIVLCSILGNGGDNAVCRIASINKVGESASEPTGIILCGQGPNAGDLRSFYTVDSTIEYPGRFSGNILGELKIVSDRFSFSLNDEDRVEELADTTLLASEEFLLFSGGLEGSSTILLHEVLFLPASVTDEQIVAGVQLLSDHYDFPLTP